MTPRIEFDHTRTASHMPSQVGRRILLAAAAAQGHSIQSWDVPGAYYWAPNDPRYRVVMAQPPRSDWAYEASGKVCVICRAMPGAPDANALWDSFRDMWLKNWGWHKFLAEPSMFWIDTREGMALTKVDNDDFLITGPSDAIIDELSQPLRKAWNITVQTLTPETSLQTRVTVMRHMDADQNGDIDPSKPNTATDPKKMLLQHVRRKVTKFQDGSIQIRNPKVIEKAYPTTV